MSERPFERRDLSAAKDRSHDSKVNRTLDEALMRSDRKRRLGNKSGCKDEPGELRLDHRSSLACNCSSIKCSASINSRPVNFHSSLQCNSPADSSSTHGNSSRSRSPLSQPSNGNDGEPRSSCSLANRFSVNQASVNHSLRKSVYFSSLRSPPAKRTKTDQLPLQPSPGHDWPPARLDNKTNNSSSGEVNCSGSSALPRIPRTGNSENNFNNFGDHENDTGFADCDKAADHQNDNHPSNDKPCDNSQSEDRRRTDGKVSSRNETVRAKNCDSGKGISNASNDEDDSSDDSRDSLRQPDGNRREHTRQPLAVRFENGVGGDLVDRQRSNRIKRFLTCSGPVNDAEYWRLKCERLSKELKQVLNELNDLENESELLELELAELCKLSSVSNKLKRLLQMLGF